jgi:hypothetical protein
MLLALLVARFRTGGNLFQWAPTLGGECYNLGIRIRSCQVCCPFQWAPTLGGECYPQLFGGYTYSTKTNKSFNGHPPLGVNATGDKQPGPLIANRRRFQWAPTLGGECYARGEPIRNRSTASSFNGHPPLGVNATCHLQNS